MNENGLCRCGCGGNTNLIKKTITKRGLIAGQRFAFLRGHWAKANGDRISETKYRSARSDHGDGYLTVTERKKVVLEHRAIAERVLGKPLPSTAIVHHADDDRSNNSHANLIICQDRAYHKLIHQRSDAYRSCGHANWRRCVFCGVYDDPVNLYIPTKRGAIEHRKCGNEYRKAWAKERRRAANG